MTWKYEKFKGDMAIMRSMGIPVKVIRIGMYVRMLISLLPAFVVVAVILICLSTMFIKQHSAVDFFAALPVCLLAEGIVYGRDYRAKWLRQKQRR